MVRCDEFGRPCLVQDVKYLSYDMTVLVTFFDGRSSIFPIESLDNGTVGLMQNQLTSQQVIELERSLEILVDDLGVFW